MASSDSRVENFLEFARELRHGDLVRVGFDGYRRLDVRGDHNFTVGDVVPTVEVQRTARMRDSYKLIRSITGYCCFPLGKHPPLEWAGDLASALDGKKFPDNRLFIQPFDVQIDDVMDFRGGVIVPLSVIDTFFNYRTQYSQRKPDEIFRVSLFCPEAIKDYSENPLVFEI